MRATAFAPASVGNVAIGFDILGFAVDALGDRVTVARREGRDVTIEAVPGSDLPLEPERNTAGRALLAMHAALELLKFAMAGEAVASGARHVDNIAPSLFGGLVLTVGIDHPRVKQIPVPHGVRAVVVHPHMFLATSKARAILKGSVPMSDFVWQTANLAGFISGCYTDDLDMIRASFEDVVIEPQRQALIPGFQEVRRGAMAAGALGCSISGAGPSMFAWTLESNAAAVRAAMCNAFARQSLATDDWVVEIRPAGARVIEGV